MTATKADSGAEEIMEMFLRFLENRGLEPHQMTLLFEAENISKDSVFTLLMRNNTGFATARKLYFQVRFIWEGI